MFCSSRINGYGHSSSYCYYYYYYLSVAPQHAGKLLRGGLRLATKAHLRLFYSLASNTFLRILAVPKMADFWIVSVERLMSSILRCAESLVDIVWVLLLLLLLLLFVCLCILHQSYLTITAGTANCPILGGLGSSLHLLWRELGSLTCLRVTLPRTRNLHL